jgi:hypothetical protein
MMRSRNWTIISFCLLFPAAGLLADGAAGFQRQTIVLPGTGPAAPMCRFEDIDGDGRLDLLVVRPGENILWIYRQRPSGFPAAPDQAIALPPQTAWVALGDVDSHPGPELVASTAQGLFYFRQDRGVFESQARPLIAAPQVFTGNPSFLVSLIGQTDQTNIALPVISADEVIMYRRNDTYTWSPASRLPLRPVQAQWQRDEDPAWIRRRRNAGEWAVGAVSAHYLAIQKDFRTNSEPLSSGKKKAENENDGIQKILQAMKTGDDVWYYDAEYADLEGNGRKDLVLWQIAGQWIDVKTDVLVFRRGVDGRLPERPTQVLHGRGFPILTGGRGLHLSPLCDLKGDGAFELVLVELKTIVVSAKGVVEMALSKGLECELTVRPFRQGAFARSPDASIPLTVRMPDVRAGEEAFLIDGDFNGDHRPDLLVERSPVQWQIYFSSAKGWFATEPALTLDFETPPEGYFEIKDLNGDGLADVAVQVGDGSRLIIFLSQPLPAKGGKP